MGDAGKKQIGREREISQLVNCSLASTKIQVQDPKPTFKKKMLCVVAWDCGDMLGQRQSDLWSSDRLLSRQPGLLEGFKPERVPVSKVSE